MRRKTVELIVTFGSLYASKSLASTFNFLQDLANLQFWTRLSLILKCKSVSPYS